MAPEQNESCNYSSYRYSLGLRAYRTGQLTEACITEKRVIFFDDTQIWEGETVWYRFVQWSWYCYLACCVHSEIKQDSISEDFLPFCVVMYTFILFDFVCSSLDTGSSLDFTCANLVSDVLTQSVINCFIVNIQWAPFIFQNLLLFTSFYFLK